MWLSKYFIICKEGIELELIDAVINLYDSMPRWFKVVVVIFLIPGVYIGIRFLIHDIMWLIETLF